LKKKNKKIPRMKQEKYQDNNKKKTQKNWRQVENYNTSNLI
jgi:hypothetical protein